MRGTRWSGRAAAVLPALILAELLLVVPVAPAAASAIGPRQADPIPGKAIPPGTAVEAEAAPIDLSGAASADAAGVEVLADGTRIRPRDVKYVPPAEDTEVISARSEHTTQTANKDGSFTLDASAGRLNFLDPGGVWQAIDLSLVPAGDDSFKVASNDRQVTVSTKDANDGLVEMSGGSGILHLRVPGYGQATVSDGKTIFGLPTEPVVQPDTPASPAPSPTATAAPVTSPDAEVGAAASPSASPSLSPSPSAGSSPDPIPGASPSPSTSPSPDPNPSPSPSSAPTPSPTAEPTPTPEVPTGPIVKPDAQPLPEGTVVVEGPSGLDRITVKAVDTGFEFGAVLDAAGGSHRFTFVIEAPGLTVTLDRDGRTILLQAPQTEDGRDVMVEVGRISAPVLIDGLYMPAPESAVVVSVEALDGGETALTYTLDEAWLTDAIYPVTLDPTACIVVGGSGCTVNGSTLYYIETYAGQGNPTTYPTSPSTLRMGDDNIGSPDAAWGMLRSYLYFPPPSLFPSGTTASVVTSATLSLREDINRYGANRYLMARPLKVGWGNTSTWNDVNGKVLTGYDSPNVLTCSTGATDCTVDFDVTNAVRAHYTRRGVDWKANLGFELKMSSEGAGFWETDFYTSTNGTLSNRPKLTITYEVPKVAIDFDAKLGANYAPSSMTAGVATVLPITLTNNVSGFAFDRCTSAGDADCYQVGYRFLDQKGKTAASGQADFAADVPSAIGGANPTPIMSLAITPPSVPGTYSLRLDLIHRFGGSSGTRLYASDWAKPSAYNSRDKKVLSSDNTRWTGSSSVERDEFSVTVGSGAPGNDLKSTTTGDGGSLGIDLATRNLHYTGAGGIGFSDLVAMGVAYNYDSATAVLDCPSTGAPTKYVGMLEACGWSTNWDEHFTDTSAADQSGAYTYQDASGARSFLNTDGQGQIAGAPVLVERPRITFFDENGGGGTTLTGKLYTAASQTIPDKSGPSVVRVNADVDISLSAYTPTISLNTYRYFSFAIRTTSAVGTGVALKIHNATNSADYPDTWIVYTVGTTWSTGFAQVDYGGTVADTWRTIALRNVYDDVRTLLPGGTFDQFEVTGVVVKSRPSSSGSTYLDGMYFSPSASTVLAEPTFPTFSVNPAKASSYAEGAPGSSNSLKVTPANLAGSPTCNTTTSCWLTSSGGLYANPFVAWDWRKVGGQSVAIRFDLKDLRLDSDGAGGYATGSITYYAGSTPPSDAVNPIQVSAEVPVTWSHVTRNLLEDARQILSFYNDNPLGTSGTPPPNGPVGDDVRWTGYVLSAVDGTFALFDNLTYRSLPAASVAGSADFLATYADRSVHAFNRDGLLTSIKDRDANTVTLDYTYDTASVNSQRSYTLTGIHGPSDGGSYTRRIDISRAAGSTTLTEKLGTPGSPITGRATTFKVTSGDLVQVKPARREAVCGSTPGTPSGCTGFVYDANHRLTTVSDPRWDLTSTNGPDDYRLTVDWSSGAPMKITDKSHNGASGADLIRILAWDRGTNPLGTRALWQDSPAIAAGAAIHTDLIADGRTFIDYVPVGCTSGNCLTSGNWPTDGAGIAATKRTEHEFDGLSRVNRTTAYRTPSADPVVSRQGSRAGAKVDNYVNPLLGGQLAWSQSADQLYASRVDSANTNDDLYRTFYTYDDRGQLTHTINPVLEATPDYPRAVESATKNWNGTTNTDILAYYRLEESSGTALDANTPGGGVVGTHTAVGQATSSNALTPSSASVGATYTAASNSVTKVGTFGSVTGSFSAVAWVKPASNGTSLAILGSRYGTAAGTDHSFDLKLYVDPTTKVRAILADIGNGSAWLRPSFKAPYDWQIGRWIQVGLSVDDAADTVAIYVDGVLISSGPFTTAGTPLVVDNTRKLQIGTNGRDSVTPEWFNGSIDEVAVYKVALDRSQMANLYASARSIAVVDQATSYDSLGHPVQTTDQFLANPGFEDGIASGWRSTSATFETTTVHAGGLGSIKLAGSGTTIQERTLVPGQTFRLQGWNLVSGAGTARYTASYWKRSSNNWVAFGGMGVDYSETSWTSHAWDLPIPMDSDGRVRVKIENSNAGGSVYVDDIALFTTFAQMTYGGTGLIETTTTLSPAGGGGVVVNNPVYASSAVNPAIFATSVIVNDVGTVTDATSEDLTTTTTYDAWGRPLVTTDPDGVTSTDHYKAAGQGNGAMTDRDTVTDGAGNATTTTYDLVGNALTVQLPLGPPTTTRYDALNHPIDVTTPDTIKTTYQYDLVGQRIAVIANDVPGVPTVLDDVITSYEYDAFGRVIKTTGDDGGIEAVSESTYDLLGNVLTSTVWPGAGGTGTPRVTTSDFASANGLSRAVPTGVKLPVTSTTGHACPSGSGTCNSVSVLDLNGRTVATRDAYDNLTVQRLDLAGRAVQAIVNYVDGTGGAAEPESDLVTTTTYGLTGLVTSVTDPAARTTTTAYDAVGRPNRVTDIASGRYAKTVYRPSGRVDRVSDARTTDGALVWTKSVYDAAGRVTKTLAHYDTSGEAQISAENFEDGSATDWSSSGDFVSAGSTLTAQLGVTSPTPASGEGRLKIDTGSAANAGAVWALSGTYQSSDTYKATAWVYAPIGTTINAYLGTNTDSDTSTSIAGTGTWQALTVTWTPATNQTVAYLAYKRVGSASSVSVYLDDITVWNASAAAQNALGPDTNIPTETVYDANSRIIRSIVIGGAPGDASLVTATGYDAMGRVTSVTVNDVAGGGTTGAVNLTSTTEYDPLGRVEDAFDATGTHTTYGYDRLGRTVATTANYDDGTSSGPTGADDLRSTFAYDALGELTAYCPATAVVVDSCNPTQTVTTGNDYKSAWHYTYDAMGRMATQVAPVNVTATALDTTVWAYETGGRLASVTDQSPTLFPTIGRHVDMAYDDVGRVTSSIVYAGSGTGSPKQTTTTAYAVDGSPTQTAWNGTNDGLDSHTLDFTYTGEGWLNEIKVGGTTMTDYDYVDGLVTSRVDTNPASTGTTYATGFSYDWAQQVKAVTAGSIYATSADFTYRFDGLIASRTFPNGETLTFAYDTARRPTTITKANGNTFSQTYDRDSNVLTEARSLTGPTGDNGTNTNTLTYDALGRLTGESGLASSRSYQYDRDGNRTRKVEGGTTTVDYFYDRTDQLTKQKINGGADITFAYDRYGNMTTSRDSAGTATTYAYDTASHLTSITAGAQSSTFKFDALGRNRERTVNGVVEKYAYVGTSEVTSVITGTTTRISAVTEDGSRVATKDGSTSAFLIPDLHGNVAAMEQAAAVTIANAIRYDAYGQTMGTPYTGTGSVKLDTKYQGRLDISPSTTPLYDMSARFYSPGIGAFTQLDSYAGSVQNPATMNRFLYALGNPASLIDPTGHYAEGQICNLGPEDCGAINWVPRSDGGGGGASGLRQPSKSQTSRTKDNDSSPTTVTPPLIKMVAGVWVGPSGAPFTQGDLDTVYTSCLVLRDEAACDAWRAGMDRIRQADQQFCEVNPEACQLQAEQRTAALVFGLELIVLAAATLDGIPGDEAAVGAGLVAPAGARLAAISQELANLSTPAGPAAGGFFGRSAALSREMLNRALLAELGPGAAKPVNAQAHHIVEVTRPAAAASRAVLERFGIDGDSALNGVYLDRGFHLTDTTRAVYTLEVSNLLQRANSRDEVIATLQFVRASLLAAQAAGTEWP